VQYRLCMVWQNFRCTSQHKTCVHSFLLLLELIRHLWRIPVSILWRSTRAGTDMLTGPFYPYFQFGQSRSTMTNYSSGQRYKMQQPWMFIFSNAATTAAAVIGFAHQYGEPLSLTASPQAQAGTTSILYVYLIFF
jgi:hypothetical protein